MKKKISTLFQIRESDIDFVPGNKCQQIADTYTFRYNKTVGFKEVNLAIKEIDGLKLSDSIITKEKVVLRVK